MSPTPPPDPKSSTPPDVAEIARALAEAGFYVVPLCSPGPTAPAPMSKRLNR